jgi:hypothetical protein
MADLKGQKAARDRFAESVRPVIEQARQEGVTSFHGLADYLTERGIRPVTGKVEWSNAMVARLLARIKKLNAPNVPDHAPGQRAGSAGRTKAAQAFADSMREHLLPAVASGANSDQKIMARLNPEATRDTFPHLVVPLTFS